MGDSIFALLGRGAGLLWPRNRFLLVPVAAAVLASTAGSLAAPSWMSTVSKEPPGSFPLPRPLRATYSFGWAGLSVAVAQGRFFQPAPDRLELEGTGRTTGLARLLWRYDVNYEALTNALTLHPIESNQVETFYRKTIQTRLSFNSDGVIRTRTEKTSSGPAQEAKFSFPHLFDLQSAMFYLRSQPLKQGSVHGIVVYPTTNAYLATATVVGREKISVRAGTYNAIKINLQLKKVGKKLDLQTHHKFRRATIWVSDDADRLILRIEAQIFIGTVSAELQSVRFENSRS